MKHVLIFDPIWDDNLNSYVFSEAQPPVLLGSSNFSEAAAGPLTPGVPAVAQGMVVGLGAKPGDPWVSSDLGNRPNMDPGESQGFW